MSISILIGSGFSVPNKMPTVQEINTKFISISEEDFSYNGNRIAMFLRDGEEDPNAHLYGIYKQFFVFLIKSYSSTLDEDQSFNYEEFFDFYYPGLGPRASEDVDTLCQRFRTETGSDLSNFELIDNFHSIFSQLLSSQLQKRSLYENDTAICNTIYDPFVGFLRQYVDREEEVNIHSLNHDLLLEFLGKNTALWQYFTDGFTDLGSPYYEYLKQEMDNGKRLKYIVRLARFTNIFDKPIRLFKLHGSIDMFEFGIGTHGHDETRVKSQFGVFDFQREIEGGDGNLMYQSAWQNRYPDFLSGTTEKILQYDRPFYNTMFDHFRKNLSKANELLIIGYGFWDTGINKIIEEQFLSRDLQPVVIDPMISKSPFYSSHEFTHHKASAVDDIYQRLKI